MYDRTLDHGRKCFFRYCSEALSTAEILKSDVNDYFIINDKKKRLTLEKVEYDRFKKNYERKTKPPSMIYAEFESILAQEDKGKQNPFESYKSKYQKHTARTYVYKLVCGDDKFRKPLKSYLDENSVYNFIASMHEESKYSSDVMKKHFNKELEETKKYDENFDKSTKCWIGENYYLDDGVKVRDTCHITGKYRNSKDRDSNIKVKLNHKIPIVFLSLENYDS